MGSTVVFSNNDLPLHKSPYSFLINNSEVSFSVAGADEVHFINSTFSSKNKTVFLETIKKISFIQIINIKGEIEYQLPISANKLHIDMDDFSEGLYFLNLLLEGNDEYITTELKKSF